MGYALRLRCGKPFIHAGRTLRLVGMLDAGTLGGSELFHRCAPALEEYYDSPQNTHGDDRGHCGDGDGQARGVGGDVRSGVHGNVVNMSRLDRHFIYVRMLWLRDNISYSG